MARIFKLIALVILLSVVVDATAQGEIKKKRTLSDKVFGAGFGMQFGTISAIEASPTVGYIPLDNLYVGSRGTYEYYKDNRVTTGDASTSIYGGSLFVTYAFYENFLLYGEYEILSLETEFFNINSNDERFLLKTPLVGGGYMQHLGGRSKLMLLLLWNLDDSYSSYYNNPILRISLLF